MGKRELDPRLKELYDLGLPVYSISRLDCINHCLYEAYLTYKLHKKSSDNIYGILGTRVHDTLEAITHGEATEADLWPAVQAEFEDMELLGIEFPKDHAGNNTIKDGWLANMKHFCENYKAPKGKNLKTEELFIYTSPAGHKLQGYIDLQQVKNDGSVNIYDYKTSSLYKGEELTKHGRQLVIYALGLEQMGIKVNKVAWIMLKYVTVTYEGYKTVKSKNKTTIEKTVERRKLAKELYKAVERELEERGFDAIEKNILLDEMLTTNSLNGLPDDVKSIFNVKNCIVEYELTDETRKEVEQYVDSTVAKWESLGDDEKKYLPLEFTKTQKNGKVVPDCFYCTKLCGHYEHCPHIHNFFDEWSAMSAAQDEEDKLFE